jgi:hypothetical protein
VDAVDVVPIDRGAQSAPLVERFALPKSGGALGQYVRSGVGRRLRFLQRMLFLSGDWCDVPELEYTVNVTVNGERARISVLDLGCEVELGVCESHGTSELGLGAEDVLSAVIGMLGVSVRRSTRRWSCTDSGTRRTAATCCHCQ